VTNSYNIHPIGIVHSPFKEKFGTPRQPGLVKAKCSIELLPPYNRMDALKGLEGFSHIWIHFIFHQAIREQHSNSWQPTVRPPRLGGNEKVGVFASRSPFRPNNIGLSVARLVKIEQSDSRLLLHVEGLDIVDGTPVIDIKPYIPYVDAIPDAFEGFATGAPEKKLSVTLSDEAENQLKAAENPQELRQLIIEVLQTDPRPAYKSNEKEGEYGILLYEYNIRWRIVDNKAVVEVILKQ